METNRSFSWVGVPVLIVEDDLPTAKMTAIVLADVGAEVRIATRADDALAMLSTWKPALVVLDVVLLDGLGAIGLARAIKDDERTREIVIVAVSSLTGPHAVRAARDAGCIAYLHKPIDIESFAETLSEHLKGRV